MLFCVANGEIKAERGKATWLMSHSCGGQSWNSNAGSVGPQVTPLPTQCHGVVLPGSRTHTILPGVLTEGRGCGVLGRVGVVRKTQA